MAGATAIHPLSLNPRLDATNLLIQHLMHIAHAPTVLWGVALFIFPHWLMVQCGKIIRERFLFCVCYGFCVFCVVARRSEFAPCTQKNAVVDDEIASWPRLIDTIIDAHFFSGKLLAKTHASNRLID